MAGLWTEARGQQKQSNDPRNNQHHPQYANYRAPLTRKRHIPPHPAQPRHTNDWASRTRKRHRQEHRPQRSTQSSDPTQHAKGRRGARPGPRKGAKTRRNVTQGGGAAGFFLVWVLPYGQGEGGCQNFWVGGFPTPPPPPASRATDCDCLTNVVRHDVLFSVFCFRHSLCLEGQPGLA